ncbi:PREDICTED: astakine-like [Vollenhovia emeryi]|uniref:astakine-like n=1 Tax=Vollenhovia emeryi TaxID=411798 RepID=UPI0005F43909|nr:PREDICTED: astakine-like [Vollenhovia emeryi]
MRSSVRAIIHASCVAAGSGPRARNDSGYQAQTAIMSPMPGVLLFISIVTLPNISSIPLSSENCVTNSECQTDSCCVLGASRYVIPTCMPFQQIGETCRVNAATITTNLSYPDNSQLEVTAVHFILCPCAAGLSCDSKHGTCE